MISLLIIIYISFISLGLPDSLLGSAWPVIQVDLSASLGLAGYVSMTVQAGTIISSLFSNRLISKFGTGKVTFVSVTMTALSLIGYSTASNIWILFIAAIPLGLGGGSVDAALNNFVAVHYKSKHMSWLHCFWGIGATTGPAIMSLYLARQSGWRSGYLTIAIIQAALAVILLLTLPLWNKNISANTAPTKSSTNIISNRQALKIPYVKLALLSFVFYCATELTTGLWISSYLVKSEQQSAIEAARVVSFYYAGITIGRFISGFASIRFKSHTLIRTGQLVCLTGAILLLLPLSVFFSILGIILIGLGCAPIFPSMLHETPNRFGANASQAIMGLQMAFAYLGSSIFPPIFGALASIVGIGFFPYFILSSILIMFFASELLQRKISAKSI